MRRSLKSHARTIDVFQEDSRVQIPMSASADPHTQIQTTTPIDGSDLGARRFLFDAYYVQKPPFSELFERFVDSPVLHKIDDELREKPPFRIYKNR
jgi:hypothetical protein